MKTAPSRSVEFGQPGTPFHASGFGEVACVLIIAWLARLNFIFEIPSSAHSFDINSWSTVAGVLSTGGNPYQTTDVLNWPPLWLLLIFLIAKMSTLLSLDFFQSLQLLLIAAESGVIILTARLIRKVAPASRVSTLLVLGIALNPIAILQVCEHCNFDVIVALWLLLFMISLLRYNRTGNSSDWLCACLFLGLGILTKTIPLILVPLLAGGFSQASRQIKLLGITLLLGPAALGLGVIYVLSPTDIITKVFEYRSQGGYFGFSGLLRLAGIGEFTRFCDSAFYFLLVLVMALISIWFWRRQSISDGETVLLAALLLAAIPALGPGYAPQYIYWFMPFLIATFAFFKGKFRFVLAGFAVIAVCTYLIDYALVGAYGSFLMKILALKNMKLGVSLIPLAAKIQKPTGETLLRLPLFASYLVLLAVGANVLFQSWKRRLEQNHD
jgi:hypothetical protein